MARLAIANVIALSGCKAKLGAIGYFDVNGATEAEDDVAFGSPVIGQISRRVFHHTNADFTKLASSP